MNNDVFTLDDNNNAAIRTIGVNGIAESNSPSVFTEDENGNAAIRVVGSGGGSDVHNLGWYATESALTTAHPTAEAGDFAIVGSTDTVWVWDTDTSAWVDTDTKGQVTPDMIIVKSSTMPSASTTPAGAVYQYTGTTTSSYTHGYIYENKETISYTDSVEFNPASISGTTVTATTGALAGLCAEYGSGNITDIIKGTLTYDLAGGLLVFVGLDDTDTQVCSFQLYTQDYEDAGFTFTGTLQDGDVITFTCTISEVASYAWERIDVQPTPSELPNQSGNSGKFLTTDGTNPSWATVGGLPSQTGNAGKFLTTDGTDASWSDKPLVNTATGNNSLGVLGNTYGAVQATAIGASAGAEVQNATAVGYTTSVSASAGIAIGSGAEARGKVQGFGINYSYGGIAIGYQAGVGSYNYNRPSCIALGNHANVVATGAMQINLTTVAVDNFDDNTVKIANANGNFEIMSADGTIPADRTSPITTISSATVTQALANNYIYNCTVDMTSIEITLPATPTANFCAQLNFTSGSTPTAFTSPAGMVWLGDDVSTTFVPVANKRYAIMVFFDGVSTRGIVQAA